MTLARIFALVLMLASAATGAMAQARHGLSAFGDLKYPPDFRHFDYVNPNAPKGGELRAWQLNVFDNLNPLILKGVMARDLTLAYQSLMVRAMDEPDAVYAALAESAELSPDRRWAAFNLNPKARWHDGTPVTAEDVVFTFEAVKKDGHPLYQLVLRDLDSITAETPLRVVFRFKESETLRDLPLTVAQIPIMSKAWFTGRDFANPTIEPPLASGPYKIAHVNPGRTLIFERVKDWWAKDLPVYRGRYNFDFIREDYYHDRDIALQAFFSGEYDFREEIIARAWATAYHGKPAFDAGRIKREVLKDETPSGVQAFFLNSRKPHLSDRRVRQALNLAFDYEWMNKTLFYSLYKRTRSMFENSDLAATGLPSEAELKLLEPFRGRIPDEVFTTEFQPPVSDGSGNNRANLKKAQELLLQAGWRIKDGLLVDSQGKPFELEFLLFEPSFQRIINPFARSLERIGITVAIRLVDVSAFENRLRSFDFDVIGRRFSQPLTPGVEQRNFWTSQSAASIGSFNYSGIRDPVVDELVEHIVTAKSRDELRTATRALDRVLMWGWYVIPNWYSGTVKLGYWDRFARPAVKPAYDTGLMDTWWIDSAKDKALNLARQR
ncbi:extracellular solute-binding protein [uncultured Ferrovibrio sp.]|uniref:extracellular solute-binding protein n=1 Tax=uncultured Ferrovibrio sp. TaxID=1576913 RepID=UPI002608607C|nr:extracellular solute-binding protein [uncultured Ferrovibrio sp.]